MGLVISPGLNGTNKAKAAVPHKKRLAFAEKFLAAAMTKHDESDEAFSEVGMDKRSIPLELERTFEDVSRFNKFGDKPAGEHLQFILDAPEGSVLDLKDVPTDLQQAAEELYKFVLEPVVAKTGIGDPDLARNPTDNVFRSTRGEKSAKQRLNTYSTPTAPDGSQKMVLPALQTLPDD